MRISKFLLVALSVLAVSLTLGAAGNEKTGLRANLTGIQEVVAGTIITDGTGTFTGTINNDNTLTYTLTYKNLSSSVLQAHIHIGATKTSGAVSIFL